MLDYMITKFSIDINKPNGGSDYPIHYACRKNTIEVIEFLLTKGI
jgi:ankyrin repeat protein